MIWFRWGRGYSRFGLGSGRDNQFGFRCYVDFSGAQRTEEEEAKLQELVASSALGGLGTSVNLSKRGASCAMRTKATLRMRPADGYAKWEGSTRPNQIFTPTLTMG